MYTLLQLTVFYALLQIKAFTCLVLVIDFCIYKCNWQILLPLFLYASLQKTHFVLTTAIDLLFNLLWWTFPVSNISMYDIFILHYCIWLFLYELLLLLTVWNFAIANFCMCYFALQFLTFVCNIALDTFLLHMST